MEEMSPKFGERLKWLEEELLMPARELAKLDAMVGALEKNVVLEIRKKHMLFERASRLEEIAAQDPNPLRRRAASAELGQRERMASDVVALRANARSDIGQFMAIEDKGGIVKLARQWLHDLSHGNFPVLPSSEYADFHCGAELRAFAADFLDAHIKSATRIALYAGHRGTDMLRYLLKNFPHARTFDVMKEMDTFHRNFVLNDDIEKQAKLLVNLSNARPRSIYVTLRVVENARVEVKLTVWDMKALIRFCLMKPVERPSSDAVVKTLAYLLNVDVAKHPAVAKVVPLAIRRCIDKFTYGKIDVSQARGEDLPLVAAKLTEWADREFAGSAEMARAYLAGLFPPVKKSKRSSCGWEFVDLEKHPKKPKKCD